jgi:hypothetical protein
MQPKPSDRLAVAEPIVIVDDVRLRRHRWRVAFSRLNLGVDGRQQADRDCAEKSNAGPQAVPCPMGITATRAQEAFLFRFVLRTQPSPNLTHAAVPFFTGTMDRDYDYKFYMMVIIKSD